MKLNRYIKDMIPYSSKLVKAPILLNANETTNYLFKEGIKLDFNTARYPISTPKRLQEELAKKIQQTPQNILLGNGSTELLELAVKTFTEPSDTILTIDPSFTMYDVYSQMYGCSIKKATINQSEEDLFNELLTLSEQFNPSLIFICNPNNPTGTLLSKLAIQSFLTKTNAVVIVDEAYMEFANEQESLISNINTYPNLLIARTFSKAYGLASLRLGYMIGNETIISNLSKAKLPYSLNEATAQIGLKALQKQALVKTYIQSVINERNRVYTALSNIGYKVLPSSTNFILIPSLLPLQDILLSKGILIRNLQNNTYRITIGTPEENTKLIQALQEVYNENIDD